MTEALSPQHQTSLWRGVVSLNNTAVSLLADHHCYQQAQLILKDAVSLLKLAVAMNGSDVQVLHATASTLRSRDPAKSSPSIGILRRLKDAQERAHHLACHAIPYAGPRLAFSVVCDDEDCTSDILDSRYASVARPIHIVYPEVHAATGGNQDRFMAVVSYNYALAFLCNARLTTASRASKLQEIAAKILRVATTFIAGAVCGHQDDDYPERTLSVAVLTLKMLISTIQQSPGHHVETVRRMHSLRLASQQLQAIRLLQRACVSGSSFIAAPAA